MSRAGARVIAEKLWLLELMKQSPKHLLWQEMAHLSRLPAYRHKKYVVWQMSEAMTPVVQDVLTVTDIGVQWKEGFTLTLTANDSRKLYVRHEPEQVFNYPLFLWIPQHTDACWVPDPGRMSVRLGLLCKARTSPERALPGNTLLTEVSIFRAAWPQFKDARF